MAKYKITDVIEWWEDEQMEEGDASHEGWHAVRGLLYDEEEAKRESHAWCDKHLPKTIRLDARGLSEEMLVERLGDLLMKECGCEYDYLKPIELEYKKED